MTTKNDITGDTIQTSPTSEEYRKNYDSIFQSRAALVEENGDLRSQVRYLRGEIKRLQEVIAEMRNNYR